MDQNKKYEKVLRIYEQQHYFIERHDSMAEKFMNMLLIELTCLSIVYTLILDGADSFSWHWWQWLPSTLFVVVFVISLIKLLLIVRPLSSKAKQYNDESLVQEQNKASILKSSFYYQGIVSQMRYANKKKLNPFDYFLEHINERNLTEDLTQQIFVLAQYSNYKKDKLEKSINWIIATTILGVISVVTLLL